MKLQTLALAAGLVMSGGAHALTVVSYELGGTATQDLGSFGASIEWMAGVSVPKETINHTFTFMITEDLFAGSGISDTPLNFTIGSVINQYKNITGLTATIYKSDNTYHVGFVENGDADHLTLPDNTFFAAGAYTMIVGGNATGSSGGLYNIAAVTAPVPEPEAWGMLLAGLGLIGLRLRQRMRATEQAMAA
jgi:hypothetical protein